MKEEKMLKIMAGAILDAKAVINHIWEQTEDPMTVLNNICDLRRLALWNEYSVHVIPFLLELTETEPRPETSKYVGRAYGKKAHIYANLFSVALFAYYADYINIGMDDDMCCEKAEENVALETEES